MSKVTPEITDVLDATQPFLAALDRAEVGPDDSQPEVTREDFEVLAVAVHELKVSLACPSCGSINCGGVDPNDDFERCDVTIERRRIDELESLADIRAAEKRDG